MSEERKEVLQKAYVFDTPDGTELFRLASIKGRLKLEKSGLKSRSGATRPKIAGELGLSPRDSFETFLAELQKRIDALKAKILRERMTVEVIDPDTTMVMSGDRSATVMAELSEAFAGYRVTYQEAGKLDTEAKPATVHRDEADALDAAEAWVCAVR